MPSHFAHLHVHTDYSLLDGAISIEKLIAFGKKHSMQAVGISDHGNIFGAVKFFQQCQKAGIKPILGMEAYLTEDATVKDINNKYHHLLIIVENSIGYKNLCALIAYSYGNGFYFKPRIDYKALEAYSEGLIVTTACGSGHIPSLLLEGNDKESMRWLDWYMRVFDTNRFFLEVQPEIHPDQKIINERLWDLAQKKGLATIATCDSHYVSPDDHEAHEVMLAIQTHHKMTDPDRFTFGECQVHLRSTDEMVSLFPAYQEAIWNTGTIADRCTFAFQTGKLFFPQYHIPKEYTQESYFRKLCQDGLEALLHDGHIEKDQESVYWARLDEEIALIISMGYIGYFLVVSDFISWAKKNAVPVGPGRGSVAGSLVAWALQITGIDPIKYNLLFERFLNPERVSMPDIDIDFCVHGRDRVINYVREKYGHDKVCQIITFGTLMAKGVIKDVARTLGFPFEDANALTDLIPDQLKITLKEAVEEEPRLKKLIETNPEVAKLFDLAFRLEGLTRHASKHAAGIVISPEPITDMLPVYVPPKTNELVTQYSMTDLEYLGFLKMDFLGLKNLTLIEHVLKSIQKNHGIIVDIAKIPRDDEHVFHLLCKGDTTGVFQLESDGIRDVLQRLRPHVFEDIIAVNALYRPGPLNSGMVDDFIERKHGRQAITYIFPELEPLLKETYGVIVYQEQVMRIASTIAGYSLGEADILRRAMGKKKAEEMDKQKSIFVTRSTARGFDPKKAEELFDLMAYFAGYGFNKSHSAAYALIAYQTAFLKTHYPREFMACLVSLEVSDPEKMAFYLDHARAQGLDILTPDINSSDIDFDVVHGALRFGLRGIRNVGTAALETILKEREGTGLFKDMLDLCMRIDLRTCNKRVLESLISAGACDQLPGNRAQKYEELEKIIEIALAKKQTILTGQLDLFESNLDVHEGYKPYAYSPRDDWNDNVKLEHEKEVLGLYVTAQPLDQYRKHLTWLKVQPFLPAAQPNTWVTCCGFLKSMKTITTKKGDRMAFVQLEDRSGSAEIVVFPKVFAQSEAWFSEHTIFVVTGVTDASSTGASKIKADQLIPIDLVVKENRGIAEIVIEPPETCDDSWFETLKTMLAPGSIKLSFLVHEQGKQWRVKTRQHITFGTELGAFIEQSCGTFRLALSRPQPRSF